MVGDVHGMWLWLIIVGLGCWDGLLGHGWCGSMGWAWYTIRLCAQSLGVLCKALSRQHCCPLQRVATI